MNTRPAFISQSQDINHEYCATVVRLGEVKPVANSDFLGMTQVEGRDIIVRKDRVHEGDVMIYISNESQLDFQFLHKNNEFADEELNANYESVQTSVGHMQASGADKDVIDQFIKDNRGYFDKKCRVRMKRLRGVPSMGYLATPEQFVVYHEELKGFNWEEHIGEDFDCVYGDLFVKAYVPEHPETKVKRGRYEKRVKKYNRMIPGQFAFHYDTQQLQRNMDRLRPNTSVTISVKLHGTSGIFGNIQVKKPKWGGLYGRWFAHLPAFLQKTKTEYDLVYSSRGVIKNEDLNPTIYELMSPGFRKFMEGWKMFDFKRNLPKRTDGYYGTDIWGEYHDILKPYIPQGMTIYGEIVGYLTDSSRGIQSLGGKVYDYCCKPGTNRLMIYRIKTVEEDGSTKEWNVEQVREFTLDLIEVMKVDDEINGTRHALRINPIDICYTGEMRYLYPGLCNSKEFKELLKPRKPVAGEDKYTKDARIKRNKVMKAEVEYIKEWLSQNPNKSVEDFISEVTTHDSLIYRAWQEETLRRLKTDKRFYMEEDEPMCVNKLPREGIVLRINDDPLTEAFKLKCLRFLSKEADDVDKGKVDMEMQDRYTEEKNT